MKNEKCRPAPRWLHGDRKSTRLNSSHLGISYAVFCLKKKEHTSELQSLRHLVCRLLLENKKSYLSTLLTYEGLLAYVSCCMIFDCIRSPVVCLCSGR